MSKSFKYDPVAKEETAKPFRVGKKARKTEALQKVLERRQERRELDKRITDES
jgi:hypothetical protein